MHRVQKTLAAFLVLLLLLSVSVPVASAAKPQLNYVVLGDSIGWGSGVYNSEEACFGRIVADTNGYGYNNLARNGERSGNLLNRLQKKEVQKIVGEADIISISVGGNDFLKANLPLLLLQGLFHQYKRFNSVGAEYRANFAKIIETIRALNPDVTILMQTLYNPGNVFVRSTYQQATNRINGCIRDYLAAHPGAFEIVDVAAAFGSNLTYIAADTIHPNAKGNVKIAQLTLEKLHELGLGEATEPVVLHAGIDQVTVSPNGVAGQFRMFLRLLRRVSN